MNMNKKIFFLFLFTFIFIPTIKVDADSVVSKSVSYSCKCTNNNGSLECYRNNCTSDIALNKLQEKCGEGGTLSNVTYTCDGYSGNSPDDACINHNNAEGNNEQHLGVKASAVCKPGATVRVGEHICEDTRETLRFLGYLIFFGKILVPFIIIVMGTMDLYKSITSGKDDSLNKQMITFGKRVLAGIIIFFIPVILDASLALINDWSNLEEEWKTCSTCLLDPTNCD